MKIKIKKIAPLQAGKMLAALYGLLGLVLFPFLLLATLAPHKSGGGLSIVMAFVFPVMYTLAGFIGGIISSFIYNIVARWFGGIELDFEEEKA